MQDYREECLEGTFPKWVHKTKRIAISNDYQPTTHRLFSVLYCSQKTECQRQGWVIFAFQIRILPICVSTLQNMNLRIL